jgi:hypothetical protein
MIEMRGNQYSCWFQRMLLYCRKLTEAGGVESLTLRLLDGCNYREWDL